METLLVDINIYCISISESPKSIGTPRRFLRNTPKNDGNGRIVTIVPK